LVVQGRIVDIVDSIHETSPLLHSPLQTFDMVDINISELFDLDRFNIQINLLWGHNQEPISRIRLLRTLLADGANPGENEGVLQSEAAAGLSDWRIEELLKAYEDWNDIQLKAKDPFYYESRLNAEALMAYGGVMKNRSLITTRKRRLGIAPSSVQTGDHVCILQGSHTPVILRIVDDGYFTVTGQAYVENIMKGEAVDWIENEAEVFALV
jgi:hypothetical protein